MRVVGMSCDGCARAVQNALVGVAGVQEATVSLDGQTARVLHDGGSSLADMVAAVEAAGYSAEPA